MATGNKEFDEAWEEYEAGGEKGEAPSYTDYMKPNPFTVKVADDVKAGPLPKKSEEYRQKGGWVSDYQQKHGFNVQDTIDYKTNDVRHKNDPDIAQAYKAQEMGNQAMKQFIASFESSGGNYKALNKTSKAYGKYQHLPSTTRKASKALGKSVKYLRTPEGQEEAQDWLMKENIAELKRRGIPITPTNVYGIHQQGGYLLEKMVKGKPLSARDRELIKVNTPRSKQTGDVVGDWMNAYGSQDFKPTATAPGYGDYGMASDPDREGIYAASMYNPADQGKLDFVPDSKIEFESVDELLELSKPLDHKIITEDGEMTSEEYADSRREDRRKANVDAKIKGLYEGYSMKFIHAGDVERKDILSQIGSSINDEEVKYQTTADSDTRAKIRENVDYYKDIRDSLIGIIGTQ